MQSTFEFLIPSGSRVLSEAGVAPIRGRITGLYISFSTAASGEITLSFVLPQSTTVEVLRIPYSSTDSSVAVFDTSIPIPSRTRISIDLGGATDATVFLVTES